MFAKALNSTKPFFAQAGCSSQIKTLKSRVWRQSCKNHFFEGTSFRPLDRPINRIGREIRGPRRGCKSCGSSTAWKSKSLGDPSRLFACARQSLKTIRTRIWISHSNLHWPVTIARNRPDLLIHLQLLKRLSLKTVCLRRAPLAELPNRPGRN